MQAIKHFLGFVFILSNLQINAIYEQDFIDKVNDYEFHLAKDKIALRVKVIELDSSRKKYSNWQPSVELQLNNSHYNANKNTSSSSSYTKENIKNSQSITLTADKRFLNNPGSFSTSIKKNMPEENITRYKQTTPHDTYETSNYDIRYQAGYKYPLLKHDSNAESLKTYHRNLLDLDKEKLDLLDAKEEFLVDRLEEYLLWYWYFKREKIYEKYHMHVSGIDLKNNKNQSQLTLAIDRANADISGNHSKLITQKNLLSLELEDKSLLSEEPIIDINKRIKIKKYLMQYLINNNRALGKINISKRLKTIDISYYKNQNLPKLDVSLNLIKDYNKGNTLSTQYDNNDITYSSNVTFNMPIGGNTGNQATLDIANLALQSLSIDYNDKLQDLMTDLKSLDTELALNEKTLTRYASIIPATQKNLVEQQQQYNNNQISLKDLIDALKDQRDVELEYIGYVINYQENILKYRDLLDDLI